MKHLINWKKSGIGGLLGAFAFLIIYYLFSYFLNRKIERLGSDVLAPAILYPPTIQEFFAVFLIGFVIGATIVYLVDLFIYTKKRK